MTGKENVIAAMQAGARFKVGGFAHYTRLQFTDGSTQRVHGSTAQAVVNTGCVKPINWDPWSPMSTEYVLEWCGARCLVDALQEARDA